MLASPAVAIENVNNYPIIYQKQNNLPTQPQKYSIFSPFFERIMIFHFLKTEYSQYST